MDITYIAVNIVTCISGFYRPSGVCGLLTCFQICMVSQVSQVHTMFAFIHW